MSEFSWSKYMYIKGIDQFSPESIPQKFSVSNFMDYKIDVLSSSVDFWKTIKI